MRVGWPDKWGHTRTTVAAAMALFVTALSVYCPFERWVRVTYRDTVRTVQSWSILTRLVLAQAIVTVLVALRTERFLTYVPLCVGASGLSVVEAVVYQWYLTKHYGARLELVSQIPGFPVSNKGLLAIYR